MAKRRNGSGSCDRNSTSVLIFVDNSNVFGRATQLSAETKDFLVPTDVRMRLNFRGLRDFVAKHRRVHKAVIYGKVEDFNGIADMLSRWFELKDRPENSATVNALILRDVQAACREFPDAGVVLVGCDSSSTPIRELISLINVQPESTRRRLELYSFRSLLDQPLREFLLRNNVATENLHQDSEIQHLPSTANSHSNNCCSTIAMYILDGLLNHPKWFTTQVWNDDLMDEKKSIVIYGLKPEFKGKESGLFPAFDRVFRYPYMIQWYCDICGFLPTERRYFIDSKLFDHCPHEKQELCVVLWITQNGTENIKSRAMAAKSWSNVNDHIETCISTLKNVYGLKARRYSDIPQLFKGSHDGNHRRDHCGSRHRGSGGGRGNVPKSNNIPRGTPSIISLVPLSAPPCGTGHCSASTAACARADHMHDQQLVTGSPRDRTALVRESKSAPTTPSTTCFQPHELERNDAQLQQDQDHSCCTMSGAPEQPGEGSQQEGFHDHYHDRDDVEGACPVYAKRARAQCQENSKAEMGVETVDRRSAALNSTPPAFACGSWDERTIEHAADDMVPYAPAVHCQIEGVDSPSAAPIAKPWPACAPIINVNVSPAVRTQAGQVQEPVTVAMGATAACLWDCQPLQLPSCDALSFPRPVIMPAAAAAVQAPFGAPAASTHSSVAAIPAIAIATLKHPRKQLFQAQGQPHVQEGARSTGPGLSLSERFSKLNLRTSGSAPDVPNSHCSGVELPHQTTTSMHAQLPRIQRSATFSAVVSPSHTSTSSEGPSTCSFSALGLIGAPLAFSPLVASSNGTNPLSLTGSPRKHASNYSPSLLDPAASSSNSSIPTYSQPESSYFMAFRDERFAAASTGEAAYGWHPYRELETPTMESLSARQRAGAGSTSVLQSPSPVFGNCNIRLLNLERLLDEEDLECATSRSVNVNAYRNPLTSIICNSSE